MESQTEVAALFSQLRASAEVWRDALGIPTGDSAGNGAGAAPGTLDLGASSSDQSTSTAEGGREAGDRTLAEPDAGAGAGGQRPDASATAPQGGAAESILSAIQTAFSRLTGPLRSGAPGHTASAPNMAGGSSSAVPDLLSRIRQGRSGPFNSAFAGRIRSLAPGSADRADGATRGGGLSPSGGASGGLSAGGPSAFQAETASSAPGTSQSSQDASALEPGTTAQMPQIDMVNLNDVADRFREGAPSRARPARDELQTRLLRQILAEQEQLRKSLRAIESRPSMFS